MYFSLFSFGSGEILLIIFVAILLFGGEELPKLMRTLGRGINEFRKATDDIKREFTETTYDIEEDIRSEAEVLEETIKEIEEESVEIIDEVKNTDDETKYSDNPEYSDMKNNSSKNKSDKNSH